MKNIGGRGVLWLTTHPMRMRILSECTEPKDLSLHPMKAVCPAWPDSVGERPSGVEGTRFPDPLSPVNYPLFHQLLMKWPSQNSFLLIFIQMPGGIWGCYSGIPEELLEVRSQIFKNE